MLARGSPVNPCTYMREMCTLHEWTGYQGEFDN